MRLRWPKLKGILLFRSSSDATAAVACTYVCTQMPWLGFYTESPKDLTFEVKVAKVERDSAVLAIIR